jgi:hypothetical protein
MRYNWLGNRKGLRIIILTKGWGMNQGNRGKTKKGNGNWHAFKEREMFVYITKLFSSPLTTKQFGPCDPFYVISKFSWKLLISMDWWGDAPIPVSIPAAIPMAINGGMIWIALFD